MSSSQQQMRCVRISAQQWQFVSQQEGLCARMKQALAQGVFNRAL
jgi:hypothetical protein